MPTLPRLVSLWIAILLGCACEDGKPSSHTRYVRACANGCGSVAGASAGASTVHGAVGEPPDDSDEEPAEIRVEEVVQQVQRVLGSGQTLAAPVLALRGADREGIARRMRELEREIAELERRLRAADARPR